MAEPSKRNRFVLLNRTFHEIARNSDVDDSIDLAHAYSLGPRLSWDDLLKGFRTVILSEAGTGKTEEIRQVTKQLRTQGRIAFFLRLEHIPNDFEDAFEEGSHQEFDAWLSSTDEGFLFLDSVDEARLRSPSDFERAIRKLGRRIQVAKDRTRIILTGRASAWRPKTDLALCEQHLPITPTTVQPAEPQQTEDADIDAIIAESVVALSESAEGQPSSRFRIVALDDLSVAQIATFVESRGITDAKAFIEEIDRKDAATFATRPQDLEELIEFWTMEHRIGSRLDLMRNSIERRLEERDQNHREAHPLSLQRAREGARLLAAASVLAKEPTIQVPDGAHTNKGIPVQAILPDWNELDSLTLLSRPIFDEAIYGTVRFHHRSVREFLVAEWLSELLARPASRREVESLLFREQYGIEVAIPTMRPILPWLAIFDDHIRDRIRRISPEIMFEGGDPSSLPLESRREILKDVCRELASGVSGRSALDYSAVQRFASPELTADIRDLLSEYSTNEDLTTFLMRMIWTGRLAALSGEAKALALSPSRSTYARTSAIRALKAIGDEQAMNEVRRSSLLEGTTLSRELLAEIISDSQQTADTAAWMLSAIDKAEPAKRFSVDPLGDAVESFIQTSQPDHLPFLVQALNDRLSQTPHVERRFCEVSQRNAWLLKAAALAVERLIRSRSPDALKADAIEVLRKLKTYRHWDSDKNLEATFDSLVPQWPELNHAAFWHDVRAARKLRFGVADHRITSFWQASAFGSFWKFGDADFDYAASAISSSLERDDKLVALSLAFHIYNDNPDPIRKEKLLDLVRGNAELELQLDNFLNPPANALAQEERKWKRLDAAREMRKRANEDKSKAYILSHVEDIRSPHLPSPDDVSSAQWYLHEWLRERGDHSDHLSATGWRGLTSEFGDDVAKAFRDGVVSYWRRYRPTLLSEGAETNSIPVTVIFGLTGLQIEASESADWTRDLTNEDVLLACRYAVHEINGFPRWFPGLYETHPDAVAGFFLSEIRAEMASELPDKESYYLLSDIRSSGQWAWDRLAPDLFGILRQHDGKNPFSLDKLLTIVQGSNTITDGDLAMLAQCRATEANTLGLAATWYAVWVGTDPDQAIPAVTKYLTSLADAADQTSFAMTLVTRLMGGRSSSGPGTRAAFSSPRHLKDLFLLTLTYVREEEDIDRVSGGVYSPSPRDDAQDARNSLYNQLTRIPGKESFIALDQIAKEHPKAASRPWLATHARRKAEQDADIAHWSPNQVRDFHDHLDRTPSNHRELAELAVMRLLDLKDDLENGDDSVAKILLRVKEEPEMRNFLAHELRQKSHGRYTITQEEEFADGKRPDLRFHGAGFDAPVPAELKLAGKWTGPKLIERMENQLSGDYLRDVRSARGIFVLVNLDPDTRWQTPSIPKADFSELVAALQRHWSAVSEQHPHVEEIVVIGIDLTERAA